MSFLTTHSLTTHKRKQRTKILRKTKFPKKILKKKFPKKISKKKWWMTVIFTSYGVGCVPIKIRKGE